MDQYIPVISGDGTLAERIALGHAGPEDMNLEQVANPPWVSSEDLFNRWKDWAEDANVFVGSAKQFIGWMEERGFPKVRVDNQRVFRGLRMRPPTPEEQHAEMIGGYGREIVKLVRRKGGACGSGSG